MPRVCIFLDEIKMVSYESQGSCPHCGEPVKGEWKFCPACETPLGSPLCPQCRMPVKAHWKRCPECETILLCKSCGGRIPLGHTACQACEQETQQPSEDVEVFIEPATEMELLYLPAGTYMMGDTFDEGAEDEHPVHPVHLEGFYIGKYPVTQMQWKFVMQANPSKFRGDRHPAEQVNWYDAQEFITRITEAGGEKRRFSLPTEAQWEYAARSCGKEERFAGGDDVDAVAWYEENSDEMTHPVGTRVPNHVGLYDMCGNVSEWCLDIFRHDAYKLHGPRDPVCTKGGEDRVIRGGSWNLDAWGVRCAKRFGLFPEYAAAGVGFRIVMIP